MQEDRLRGSLAFLVAMLVLIAAAGLVGCGEDDGENEDQGEESQVLLSEDGHFEARFVADPNPPVSGMNQVTMELWAGEDETPVVGAQVEVEPWMPGHGHGSPEEPEVIEEGEGKYLISNIFYNMPGDWELRVDVHADEKTDHFVISYDVK